MTGCAGLGRLATTRCSSLMKGGGIARNALAQRAEARQAPGLTKLAFDAENIMRTKRRGSLLRQTTLPPSMAVH